MKVLGLISGGKDSVYNLILCQHHGHEVVALANLLPAAADIDELDSYMYQTVGHQLVEAYAECTQLPLFRRQITGSSKCKDLIYTATEDDEVEDLLSLIAFATQEMPEIEAVASGAIASDYQRLRVEHRAATMQVCSRLGLVSLAYLWMQPQASLLEGMIQAGIEAVLVKVAALGLRPSEHLGRTLQHMQPILHRLSRQFGCNVCGEGGEYETLVLDCPLFPEKRIALEAWDAIMHSGDDFARVAALHPTGFRVEPKLRAPVTEAARPSEVAAVATQAVSRAGTTMVPSDFAAEAPSSLERTRDCNLASAAVFREGGGTWAAYYSPKLGGEILKRPAEAVVQALHQAFGCIAEGLQGRGTSLRDSLLVHLYLRDMSHFAVANSVYAAYFPASKPAARVCVEALLPLETPVVVQLLATAEGSLSRKVLHVQSISRWAPACIGPYSQAVAASGLIFFAGQIGLQPPTMQLHAGVAEQAEQCFASCKAVSIALRSDLASNLLALSLYSTPEAGRPARDLLESSLIELLSSERHLSDPEEEEADDEELLDPYLSAESKPRHWQPIVTYLVVPALPKGAAVEVQPLACTAGIRTLSDRSEESDASLSRDDWAGKLCNEAFCERDVSVEALYASGSFCRADITAPGVAPSSTTSQPARFCEGLHMGLRALAGLMERARLAPSALISLQLFVRADLGLSRAEIDDAAASGLAKAGLQGEGIRSLPVLAVGTSPAAESDWLLEAFCWLPQSL